MESMGSNRRPWTPQEDESLIRCVQLCGAGKWRELAQEAGLNRSDKACRERWFNHLRPGLKRGNLSDEEKLQILELHSIYGNSWSEIARHLQGRSDGKIRNYWNKLERLHQQRAIASFGRPIIDVGDRGPQALASSSVAADADRELDINWINESSWADIYVANGGLQAAPASSSAAVEDEDGLFEELLANCDVARDPRGDVNGM